MSYDEPIDSPAKELEVIRQLLKPLDCAKFLTDTSIHIFSPSSSSSQSLFFFVFSFCFCFCFFWVCFWRGRDILGEKKRKKVLKLENNCPPIYYYYYL